MLVALSLALALATSAQAHHPGADLDEMMGSEEKFFQAIDRQRRLSKWPTRTESPSAFPIFPTR